MTKRIIPIFDKRIFWDVNFDNLDYDQYADFIIERVFERGDVTDLQNCLRYYGINKVTDSLLQAKYLPLKTLYFASAIIEKPINEFKCYILRQLNPTLFPY